MHFPALIDSCAAAACMAVTLDGMYSKARSPLSGADSMLWVPVDAEYPPWLPETHPLAGVEASMRYGCKCEVCDSFARIPLVTPCAHLVCSDCAAPHRCASPQAPCKVHGPSV